MAAVCTDNYIHLHRQRANMVYEIVHHQAAGSRPRCPIWLRTVYLQVPIYWSLKVCSHRDLSKVAGALRSISADCRAKRVVLTPLEEGFWMVPTPLEDELTFKTNVMLDLKRLLRYGQTVTVEIIVK